VALPVASTNTVQTSRQDEADLTQEGAIVGTPAYMPPEQATGNVEAIDRRSDIYSLGAILYELLTLEPPVEREGGYLAVLLQVMQGQVMPPEQRAPERARAGKIPRELSAVAMKALAKEPQDRYQHVEDLRQDIERFQEGRSVSARADTTREMLWRVVKRNKLASAFTTILAVVLLWGFWTNWQARRDVEQAQREKDQSLRDSLPSFVRAARLAANENQHDDALKQLKVVLDHDASYAEARLLRGQVLVVRQDYSEAKAEFDRYLKLAPGDQATKHLEKLCLKAKRDDVADLSALAEALQRQNSPEMAGLVLRSAAASLEGRKQLLPTYQRQINAAWPGLGERLSIDVDGKYHLDLSNRGKIVKDLSPIKDIPLTSLSVSSCDQLLDLTPLKGMPLTTLDLTYCMQVRDLSPLHKLPLTSLDLGHCFQINDLRPLLGVPLTSLSLFRCEALTDLTPLQEMKSLRVLNLGHNGQFDNIRALKGLQLTSLSLSGCLQVRDLMPLKGMPLTTLNLGGIPLPDLTPLQGMELETLSFEPKSVTRGIDMIRAMKSLKSINTSPPADFWKKFDAGEFTK
jgi:tetratricopeptide (TPR) repeat protein